MDIVAQMPFEVTDPTIESQIVTLKNSGADAFFNVSTPKFAAQAIKKVASLDWKPLQFLNLTASSIGAVLKPAGLENANGIISAQFLKDPNDPQWKEDAGYKDWTAFYKSVLS